MASHTSEETPKEELISVDKSNLTQYVGREKFTSDRLYETTPVGKQSANFPDSLTLS